MSNRDSGRRGKGSCCQQVVRLWLLKRRRRGWGEREEEAERGGGGGCWGGEGDAANPAICLSTVRLGLAECLL